MNISFKNLLPQKSQCLESKEEICFLLKLYAKLKNTLYRESNYYFFIKPRKFVEAIIIKSYELILNRDRRNMQLFLPKFCAFKKLHYICIARK